MSAVGRMLITLRIIKVRSVQMLMLKRRIINIYFPVKRDTNMCAKEYAKSLPADLNQEINACTRDTTQIAILFILISLS